MSDGASALQLVLGGDPALYAIVALSLYVSLSAVALAAIVALPFGALLALTRFPGPHLHRRGRSTPSWACRRWWSGSRSISCSRAPARSASSACCSPRRR